MLQAMLQQDTVHCCTCADMYGIQAQLFLGTWLDLCLYRNLIGVLSCVHVDNNNSHVFHSNVTS